MISAGQSYCWVDPNGEMTIFDTSRAYAWAEAHLPVEMVDLASVAGSAEEHRERCRDLNIEYALTTDVTQPVLGLLWKGAWLLADGNHRIYHALLLGLEVIPAYLIEDEAVVEAVTMGTVAPEIAARMLAQGA